MPQAKLFQESLPEVPNWELIKADLKEITDSDPLFMLKNEDNKTKDDVTMSKSTKVYKNVMKLQTNSGTLDSTCQTLENKAYCLSRSIQEIGVAVNAVENQLKHALKK